MSSLGSDDSVLEGPRPPSGPPPQASTGHLPPPPLPPPPADNASGRWQAGVAKAGAPRTQRDDREVRTVEIREEGELGLRLEPGPPMFVGSMKPGSIVERRGLKTGDEVISINGILLSSVPNVQAVLATNLRKRPLRLLVREAKPPATPAAPTPSPTPPPGPPASAAPRPSKAVGPDPLEDFYHQRAPAPTPAALADPPSRSQDPPSQGARQGDGEWVFVTRGQKREASQTDDWVVPFLPSPPQAKTIQRRDGFSALPYLPAGSAQRVSDLVLSLQEDESQCWERLIRRVREEKNNGGERPLWVKLKAVADALARQAGAT